MKHCTYPSVTVLGPTGSVGEQAMDVARQTGAAVNAICANRNARRVEEQAREFRVRACAMSDERAAADLRLRLADTDIRVYAGTDGICEMLSEEFMNDLSQVLGIQKERIFVAHDVCPSWGWVDDPDPRAYGPAPV